MSQLNSCVGKQNYHLQDKTQWYGFHNIPTRQDTRCGYCYSKLKELGLATDMFQLDKELLGKIDCDSITDQRIASIAFQGYGFQVVSFDKSTPYLVHPSKANDRQKGLLVVEMPSMAEYCVNITRLGSTDNYFTYQMKIGDREVIVNNGEAIYYKSSTNISSFETGTQSNFKFIANTEENKSQINMGGLNSNIITIKISEYKRIRPEPVYYSRNIEYGTKEVFGGRTETGHKYTSHVNTQVTYDRFEKLRDFSVTIQLIYVKPNVQEYVNTNLRRFKNEVEYWENVQKTLLLNTTNVLPFVNDGSVLVTRPLLINIDKQPTPKQVKELTQSIDIVNTATTSDNQSLSSIIITPDDKGDRALMEQAIYNSTSPDITNQDISDKKLIEPIKVNEILSPKVNSLIAIQTTVAKVKSLQGKSILLVGEEDADDFLADLSSNILRENLNTKIQFVDTNTLGNRPDILVLPNYKGSLPRIDCQMLVSTRVRSDISPFESPANWIVLEGKFSETKVSNCLLKQDESSHSDDFELV